MIEKSGQLCFSVLPQSETSLEPDIQIIGLPKPSKKRLAHGLLAGSMLGIAASVLIFIQLYESPGAAMASNLSNRGVPSPVTGSHPAVAFQLA